MRPQTKSSMARWFSGFFDQRVFTPRKRFIQLCVRSTTQRRALNPGSSRTAFFSSPRARIWGVKGSSGKTEKIAR